MESPKRYLVTAALPYANGPLHIGHIAGAYLPADIYVRYLKLKGEDVLFVCGSDEHGAAITLRAKKEEISPQEIVDKYHAVIERSFENFTIKFDIYHRTSTKLHHETAADFFKELDKMGAFIREESEQYFDEEHQQFLADRYIKGTCPKCKYDSAYGDQCEKCGSALSPRELKRPVSTLSGKKPVLRKTSHWYLPMDQHEEWLSSWIKDGTLNGEKHHNPKEWRKQVIGQCMSWIDGGLKARAMTRDLDWGVKVPGKKGAGKVLYVWLDAPIGYISASKQWAEDNNTDWEPYWKDSDTKMVHFIGKDNIVFHCIIFPILLKMHGRFNLPHNVPANEFLNLEGDKISTSRNWAVWLHEYLEEFPEKQDELRYTLCSIAPESKDSEFTWKDYQDRVNNELVAILGNLVNRVVVLAHKYYSGVVPPLGELKEIDNTLIEEIEKYPHKIGSAIEKYKFRDALAELMNLARAGNKYLADTEPWKLIKTEPARVDTIINLGLQVVANLSILVKPFMPHTSKRMKDLLNLKWETWQEAGKYNIIAARHFIGKGALLFDKIEDDLIASQMLKLGKVETEKSEDKNTNMEAEVLEQLPEISFDDFTKLDIKVGTIEAAEKVIKSDRLLQLTVNLGSETRTIVSGIAEHYSPEDVIGQQVSVLTNLAPRKIRGVESQGMILMAEDSEGKLSFVSPTDKVGPGSTIQ